MTIGFLRGRGMPGPAALFLLIGFFAGGASATDVLYVALHGEPEAVAAGALTASPGLYVGRAVRTQATVSRWNADTASFDIDLGGQRAILRLEPEAQATVASRPAAWAGRTVEVEGLFYRDGRDSGPSPYAIRAWSIGAPGTARGATAAATPARAPVRLADAPLLSLEELVYAGGRHDGKPVRVRGLYRGANVARDLPETTRRGGRDWVIKDGYFAAWVTGREARGDTWDLTGVNASTAVLEIAGVPTTSRGVVRILAQAVDLAPVDDATAVHAAATPRDAHGAADPARVSFLYPVPGEAPGARGSLVLQFNKAMDPRSFENRVRVRYEKDGAAVGTPRVTQAYRDRYRALILSPSPPPPAGADVVVELLEGVIDVDGNGVAGESRFRSAR
jgi:hypothetical protein